MEVTNLLYGLRIAVSRPAHGMIDRSSKGA
jgi:hypothetical protein